LRLGVDRSAEAAAMAKIAMPKRAPDIIRPIFAGTEASVIFLIERGEILGLRHLFEDLLGLGLGGMLGESEFISLSSAPAMRPSPTVLDSPEAGSILA
jgi:hypothetical protein